MQGKIKQKNKKSLHEKVFENSQNKERYKSKENKDKKSASWK